MATSNSNHYEITYKHFDQPRYQQIANKKDIDDALQDLVDTPGVKSIAVHEVKTTTKRIDVDVPEKSEQGEARHALASLEAARNG